MKSYAVLKSARERYASEMSDRKLLCSWRQSGQLSKKTLIWLTYVSSHLCAVYVCVNAGNNLGVELAQLPDMVYAEVSVTLLLVTFDLCHTLIF